MSDKRYRYRAPGRLKLFLEASGCCFYCGEPMTHEEVAPTRDWLFVRPERRQIVREHRTPVIRGGNGSAGNIAPSCGACNSEKASLTADEFRFIRGLRRSNLNFRFPGEPQSKISRDWLCCHSKEFERSLGAHNVPGIEAGFRVPGINARARR